MALPDRNAVKRVLKIETTDEDTLVDELLSRATAWVKGRLGRPLVKAATTMIDKARTSRMWNAPTSLILPYGPIDTGSTLTVTDVDGTVVDPTTYWVDPLPAIIYGKDGVTFPYGPYTILATVGLSARADYAAIVEPDISAAIVDVCADLYGRREPAASTESEGGGLSVSWGLPGAISSGVATRVWERIGRWAQTN